MRRRRPVFVLIALAALAVALASAGSGAMAISSGVFTASPDNVAFGHVAASSPQTITEMLTNGGNSTVTISSDSLSGPDQGDFALSNDTCQQAINAGDSCSIHITFTPSTTGSESASLDIVDDDPSSPQSVPLTGTGVANEFTVSGGPLTFPGQRVGTTSTGQSVLVTNNTDYDASPTGPTVTGANAGDFQATGCSGAVAANGSCAVTVDFTP